MNRSASRSAKSSSGDGKTVCESGRSATANALIGPLGRLLWPARRVPHRSEEEIASTVNFRRPTLKGDKPNGECRLI